MTLALALPQQSTAVGLLPVAAYLRVSRADADGRTPEEQQQTQRLAIGRLVERMGATAPMVEYIDWDRSADPARENRRDALNAMLRAVERGEVSAVYASSLDRLYRSMSTYLRITATCRDHGVPVVTDREGSLGGDGSPMAIAYGQMTATFAELELNTAKARARARVARQRAEGQHIGVHPYGSKPGEDLQAVLDAFSRAGTYNGAATLLNGCRTGCDNAHEHTPRLAKPRHADHWQPQSVARIIRRAANADALPDGIRLPVNPRPRARTLTRHIFAGLVRCPHDDLILTTSNRRERSRRGVGLFCRMGSADASHPRPYSVSERVLIEWASAVTADVLSRVARLDATGTILDSEGNVLRGETTASDLGVRMGALRERRRRVVRAYTDGNLPDADYERALADIDRQITALAGEERSAAAWLLPLTWECPSDVDERTWRMDLNVRLRDLLHSIRLDANMRPTGAVWRRRPIARDDSGVAVFDEAGNEVGDFDPRATAVDGGWLLPAPYQPGS